MRMLSRHEKKLMLFFGFAVFVGIHLLGLKLFLSLDQANQRNLLQKTAELAEAKGWMNKKAEWEEKAEWLEKNLKMVPADNPAPFLEKRARSTATAVGLKIEEQNLHARLLRLVDVYLHDNCSAWDMRSDGSFQRRIPEEESRVAQVTLMEHWRSGLNDSDDATP